MPSLTFNVALNRKHLCTTSMTFSVHDRMTRKEFCEYVKASLVNHDHYDADINVTLKSRITSTEYEIQMMTDYGWELATTELNWKQAKERRSEYIKEGHNARIVTKRASIFN